MCRAAITASSAVIQLSHINDTEQCWDVFFSYEIIFIDFFYFLLNFVHRVCFFPPFSCRHGARKSEELRCKLWLSQWQQCSRFLQRGLRLRKSYHRSDRRNSRQVSKNPRQGVCKSALDWIAKCWLQHCLYSKLHRRSGVPKSQRHPYWPWKR